MNHSYQIRPFTFQDLAQTKQIIDANQMFPSEMLDDMVQPYLEDNSSEFWCVVSEANAPDSVFAAAYCAPEVMTENTWNLLMIAVLPTHQGKGIGAQLMAEVEQQLLTRKGRLLLVETSGLPEFELTRKFYPKCGYQQVATIPEYYAAGDDKVVFWKKLIS